jgi:3-oxoacyl-[acyl-carrier protein] reductase
VSGSAGAGGRLAGLRLLATAASRGIGLAVAAKSAREGAEVVLSGSRPENLAEALETIGRAGGRVHGLVLDVTDGASIRSGVAEARSRMGGIDALFVNVPGARPGSLVDLGEADWLSAFELYVLSVLRLVRACETDLTAAAPGRVVIVTSYAAIEAIPGLTLSNVVRPAVHALVRELARGLGPRGVLVNAVAPGRIDTERVRAVDHAMAEARGTSGERVRAEQASAIPLGRYAAPDELASAAVFLLSRENTYVTGQCLLVDGGLVRSP